MPEQPTFTENEGVPFRQAVLKVQSDCNMACPDCYVYAGPDQSWATKPARMEEPVLERTAERLAEHASAHNLPKIQAIFHGGEPLMNGPQYIRRASQILRSAAPEGTKLTLAVQTNGVLLTKRMLDVLLEEDVHVGVSLNGPAEVNDPARPLKGGRGTYDIVARNLRLLGSEPYRSIFNGILCTVDPTSNPKEVLDTLAQFKPPRMDLLMMHATWESPPQHDAPATGKWLLDAFTYWASQSDPDYPQIRLFDSLIALMAGGKSQTEQIGTSPLGVVVVEADGTYEQNDIMKITYAGAPTTGMNVFEHSLDDVLALPEIRVRQLGLAALGKTCQACPLKPVCGGGQYAHRYSRENGFANPSVYCDDLQLLIRGAHGYLTKRIEEARAKVDKE